MEPNDTSGECGMKEGARQTGSRREQNVVTLRRRAAAHVKRATRKAFAKTARLVRAVDSDLLGPSTTTGVMKSPNESKPNLLLKKCAHP
jgi:hypothetical protein